jgi:hypothetical protein
MTPAISWGVFASMGLNAMEDKPPDAISRFACIGSVSLVMLRVTWDIANANWRHCFYYFFFFVAFCAIYVVIVRPFDEENQPPPEP